MHGNPFLVYPHFLPIIITINRIIKGFNFTDLTLSIAFRFTRIGNELIPTLLRNMICVEQDISYVTRNKFHMYPSIHALFSINLTFLTAI